MIMYPKEDELAEIIGDTFIDFRTDSPIKQWTKILYLLNDADFHVISVQGPNMETHGVNK
jgi:hypothetical protein